MPVDALLNFGRDTFASLSVRNYRLYFTGQAFSLIGNWMQLVAMGWLVLELTGSGTLLGSVLAVRFLPLFLLAPFAGAIVDRFDKWRTICITQSLRGVIALVLAIIVFTGIVQVWMLFAIALVTGFVFAVDNPARQTFLHEMVGSEHLRNAVTLNSTEVSLARVIGPAIAGVVISSIGIAACFFLDALSFLSILFTLFVMRRDELQRDKLSRKVSGSWRAIGPYLAKEPTLRGVLIAMAIIGTFGYEMQVSLPLLAQSTFGGGAADYAALLSAMGVGSVAGGLLSASRKEIQTHEFVLWALLFGIATCIAALMPSLGLAIVGMVVVGFFSIILTSTGNTIVQLGSSSEMRGRMMALWASAVLGSTVIGGPIIGFIGEHIGPRYGLLTGGLSAMFVALYIGARMLGRERIVKIPGWFYTHRDTTPTGSTKV